MVNYQIPQFLYDERIYSYVENLVNYGVNNLNGISNDERDKLTIKIIEVLGTDSYNIVIGSDNFDQMLEHFSNFLKTQKIESAYSLLEQLRSNSLDYYSHDIECLINEIKENNEYKMKVDGGLKSYSDKQTGEQLWRKSA